MTRISRGVAQRYAAGAASKRKRRQPLRPDFGVPAATPIGEAAVGTADAASPPSADTRSPNRVASRAKAGSRRSFAEYGAEYSYVVGDLRRVGLVAGGLLIALIALSFVIR